MNEKVIVSFNNWVSCGNFKALGTQGKDNLFHFAHQFGSLGDLGFARGVSCQTLQSLLLPCESASSHVMSDEVTKDPIQKTFKSARICLLTWVLGLEGPCLLTVEG